MITLYESLLADLDSTLDKGNIDVTLTAMNMDNSEIKQALKINNTAVETPFTIKNGVFYINATADSARSTLLVPTLDTSKYKFPKELTDTIDTAIISYACTIENELNSNNIFKNIVSASFSCDITRLDGVNIICDPSRAGNRVFPTIDFNSKLKTISNCNLEIFYNPSRCRIFTERLPVFNNVSSSSIRFIDIGGHKKTEWRDTIYHKLFEFGYTLSWETKKDSGTVQINNLTDIKKLITSKDFYARVYNEWPYRIKAKSKFTDLLDVRNFERLERVVIKDNRMALLFENTNITTTWSNSANTIATYYDQLLKNAYSTHPNAYTRNTIAKYIPITADGWRVYVLAAAY